MKSTILNTLWVVAALPHGNDSVTNGSIGLLTIFFIAFGALIILFQFVPSMLLFCSMIKGLVSTVVKRTTPAVEKEKAL